MSNTFENSQPSKCGYIPQRWITVILGFLSFINAYSMRVCLSIAITEMVLPPKNTGIVNSDETCVENFNYNNTHVRSANRSDDVQYDWNEYTQGVILSSFYWGYTCTSVLGGIICQKLGGKHTLSLGVLFTSLFTLLIPYSIEWGGATALIILRVATGLGEGTSYPAMAHLFAHWVPEDELSKAGTVVFSGAPLGTIFGMLISGIILQHSHYGWPIVFYFYGSVGLVSFLFIAAFCYSQPSDNPYISHKELTYLRNKMKNTHKNVPPTPWRYILKSPPVWASFIAKFGNTWIFMTVVSDMPKYMSSVLKFSVQDNGFLSSIPHLSTWIGATLTCWIADKVIKEGTMSISLVRKVGCTIASLGPAIFLIAASYAGCNRLSVIALQSTGLALVGCAYFSVFVNVLDLSPNYASSIEGLGNGIAVISGVLAPYLVGLITPNQTMSEWQLVFWIVFAIAATSNVIFLIFGTGQVQIWNDPGFLIEKKIAITNEIKESVHLFHINKQ
ncbi:sialin-like [Phymastichus coffea]|uniref:sialin-like n=1 Tax=Phymastichus coffea TaxID=108790 RepID=UPI00273B135E|nr:sialin-like [Phymastichus coffea]